MDVWLTWVKDGEWGDVNLVDPAHRTREAAMAWCDENRKLENGDPVKWQVTGGDYPEDYGESRHVKVDVGKGRPHVTTRFYCLQVMKLEDG